MAKKSNDKVIVTHKGALVEKYGTSGVAKIRQALNALIAADKKRGIQTRVVHLDDSGVMKKLGVRRFVDIADYRAAKVAIDGVYKKLDPDYLLILGSTDVIPHQDLRNPAYETGPDGDDDHEAWSDLPYACDTPYDRDIAKFVGPTRVVGRLPDLTGATEPSHLLKLLKVASTWTCSSPKEYTKHFGLSAYSWRLSTQKSLDKLFGPGHSMLTAPPRGPSYPKGELGARMHFINCHGGKASPEFLGQKGSSYPVSLETRHTRSVRPGTVASVECCYGAELYDSVTLGLDHPICQSYLREGAYGYFGSTTIAYGPADENGAADLICQYFLRNVLEGASIGRAALVARQQFVEECKQTDPIDLKTLAQFCLYGDPSITPVETSKETKAPKGVDKEDADRFRRRERRAKLKETGDFLQKTKPTASKRQSGVRMSPQAHTALRNIAAKEGLPRNLKFDAYAVKGAKKPRGGSAKAATAPSRYYLAISRPDPSKYRVVVVAKELNGRVIDHRVYYER